MMRNFAICTFNPGSPAFMHTTDTIDYLVIISGHVTLVLEDGEAQLGPGDLVEGTVENDNGELPKEFAELYKQYPDAGEAMSFEDLVKAGIIDPALVVKTALVNAASVAGLMLTTDVIVTELKDEAAPVEGAVS